MRISDWSSDVCSSDLLRDVARAVVASISPNLFIEKVKLLVTKPAAAGEVIVGDDLAALIDRAATDPQLHELLAADLAPFLLAAQSLLADAARSEEHTSELQPLMRNSYAVFRFKKKKIQNKNKNPNSNYKHQHKRPIKKTITKT